MYRIGNGMFAIYLVKVLSFIILTYFITNKYNKEKSRKEIYIMGCIISCGGFALSCAMAVNLPLFLALGGGVFVAGLAS